MTTFLTALERTTDPYPPPLPATPPGMTGDDLVLYGAWLANPHATIHRAYFNVRVGPDPEAISPDAPLDRRLAADVLALRIDLLLSDGHRWWIVEFHNQANLPVLGRLIGYTTLLGTTYPGAPPTIPLAIAYTCNPFLIPTFTANRIPVLTYDARTHAAVWCNPETLRARA